MRPPIPKNFEATFQIGRILIAGPEQDRFPLDLPTESTSGQIERFDTQLALLRRHSCDDPKPDEAEEKGGRATDHAHRIHSRTYSKARIA